MSTFTQFLAGFGNLFRWWIVVAPWEQGVRVRRGKVATTLGPGIHLRIPGLDRFYVESTKLRTITTGVQTVATKDNQTVTLRSQIRFRVENYERVFMTLHNAEDTIIDLAVSEIAAYVRSRNRDTLSPDGIEEVVSGRLHASEWGLTDMGINVTDFAFVRTYRLIQHDERWNRGPAMHSREVTSTQP